MKILRLVTLLVAIAIPAAAFGSQLVAPACCGGSCCPDCPLCPAHHGGAHH